jgi:hypothetical protein
MSEKREGGSVAEGHDSKQVTIIVNAREHRVPKEELSFDEIVAFYENPPVGPNVYFTVTYRRGHGHKPEGSLLPGESVRVKEGMIFVVTATDRS